MNHTKQTTQLASVVLAVKPFISDAVWAVFTDRKTTVLETIAVD